MTLFIANCLTFWKPFTLGHLSGGLDNEQCCRLRGGVASSAHPNLGVPHAERCTVEADDAIDAIGGSIAERFLAPYTTVGRMFGKPESKHAGSLGQSGQRIQGTILRTPGLELHRDLDHVTIR